MSEFIYKNRWFILAIGYVIAIYRDNDPEYSLICNAVLLFIVFALTKSLINRIGL